MILLILSLSLRYEYKLSLSRCKYSSFNSLKFYPSHLKFCSFIFVRKFPSNRFRFLFTLKAAYSFNGVIYEVHSLEPQKDSDNIQMYTEYGSVVSRGRNKEA